MNKPKNCDLIAFMRGGARLHAGLTHTAEEAGKIMEEAKKNKEPFAVLDTVNESENVEDEKLRISPEDILFFSLYTEKSSNLVLPKRGIEIVGGNGT